MDNRVNFMRIEDAVKYVNNENETRNNHFVMSGYRIYLEDVRIPLILSLTLNAILIFITLIISMATDYTTLGSLMLLLCVLSILILLIPFLYKLWKQKWKDAGIIASVYILMACYFNWFVIIG